VIIGRSGWIRCSPSYPMKSYEQYKESKIWTLVNLHQVKQTSIMTDVCDAHSSTIAQWNVLCSQLNETMMTRRNLTRHLNHKTAWSRGLSPRDVICQLSLILHVHVSHRTVIAQSGIALDYGLDGRGSRFRFPTGAGNFSLRHRVQSDSRAHSASYPLGTTGSFLGGKATGAWSWPLIFV
jgi:hypothetical protein